jgi:hypothetical protein
MSPPKEEIGKLKHVVGSEEKTLPLLAVLRLIPFVSTYLCAAACSNYVVTKIKC